MNPPPLQASDRSEPDDPFAPGNLVRLREPYKPEEDDAVGPWHPDADGTRTPEARRAWRAWPGFTHGIIAVVLARDGGTATRVSLHLYDPQTGTLYLYAGFSVPVYADFNVQELEPHKIAADAGYGTLPSLE